MAVLNQSSPAWWNRFQHVPSARPLSRILPVVAVLVLFAYVWFQHPAVVSKTTELASQTWDTALQHAPAKPATARPHRDVQLLLFATQEDENLCKAILSSTVLGYNSPVILGWGEEQKEGLKHGGTHVLKLSKLHEYLDSIDKKKDNDLVMLTDAYDIHFQLPPQVLIDRYEKVVEGSNERLKFELGAAYDKESIRNTVIFAAGKQHWPNKLDDISSWTVPESPLPEDLYGSITDSPIGYSVAYSKRLRFLNSGVLIGPLGDLKKLFQRAVTKADHVIAKEDSDQRIFAELMGEQTVWRETARLKHGAWWRGNFRKTPKDNWVDGFHVDNIIDPAFSHTPYKPGTAKQYELGITIDYFANFSHQTSQSDIGRDSTWITYDNVEEDVSMIEESRTRYDCPTHVLPELPDDITSLPAPFSTLDKESSDHPEMSKKSWSQIPLYTQLCMGTIPILVHHNGIKAQREGAWPYMWYQSYLKDLFNGRRKDDTHRQVEATRKWSGFKERPNVAQVGGAWSDHGEWMEWSDICPASTYGEELYRSTNKKDWI